MSAGELVLVVAAVLCVLGFAALVVVLVRVHDALGDVRRELDELRQQTTPLIQELHDTTDEARATVAEARADLERFDRVLGSAEAIGDAVGGTVARTSFSTPMIKAAGLARGTSRTIARLRGAPRTAIAGPVVVDGRERTGESTPERREPERRRRHA